MELTYDNFLKKKVTDILKDNNNSVAFEDTLTVRMSPHSWPERIIKVFMKEDKIFYVTKENETKEATTENIVSSILQRLKLLKIVRKTIQ